MVDVLDKEREVTDCFLGVILDEKTSLAVSNSILLKSLSLSNSSLELFVSISLSLLDSVLDVFRFIFSSIFDSTFSKIVSLSE